MIGAVLVILAVVVVIPATLLIMGGVASALLGWAARDTAEALHEGSELIDLYD